MKFEVIPLLISLIPALFVLLLAIYYLKSYIDNEEKRRIFLLHRENQKESFPVRLQAYERIALFLERISPGNLLHRMPPTSDEKKDYEFLLVNTIEQEYEHNLTQQIYISDECWNTIKTAKNATLGLIRQASFNEDVDSSKAMRESILTNLVEKGAPSDKALSVIRAEVSDMLL